MAVCGSTTSHIGHFVGNITARHLQCGLSMNCTVSYNKRGFEKVRKINMSLRNKGHPNNMLFQYFTTHVTKRWADPKLYTGFGSEGLVNLSPACFSSGTASAPGVSLDNAKGEEQVANTAADSSEAKIPLKLNSGSFYLPHPAKAKTGGEDAHFMCTLTQAIGVADGVGGWADLGIDAGLYARELMSNSLAAIQEEPKGSIDLIRALDKAYMKTKAKGSSTACIVALTEEGLYAVNLGDSGFMLVRHGYAAFKSPAQQHGFNFPYQLDCNNAGDSPSSAMVFKIAVSPGDVLIAGTDGLFDNLYDEDIKGVVLQSIEAGLGPQMTARRIAELAQQRAMDPIKSSPFSDGAQEAGFEYHGGKLDDITVVVSYIMNNENS